MNKYLLLGGAGVAAGLTYALRGKSTKRRQSQSNYNSAGAVSLDDAGTTNEMAVQIIRTLRDQAFDGNDEKLATALGSSVNEIRSWFDGSVEVDSDALIKARGLAEERNVEVPHEPVGVAGH